MPYRSGMGPLAFDRFQRFMKFQTEYQNLTEARITGGGYDINLDGPNAERAMDLLMSTHDMGEPTEPTHIFVRCLAIHGAVPTVRTLRLGFDPRFSKYGKPTSKFTDILSGLQKYDRQAVSDTRLTKTFSLLSKGFDLGSTSIQAVDIALDSGFRRHLTSSREIARLLGDFAGVRCQPTDGKRSKGDIKLSIQYTESGKYKSYSQTFGTNETITRPTFGGIDLSLDRLAAKLKRGEVPAWENLVLPAR